MTMRWSRLVARMYAHWLFYVKMSYEDTCHIIHLIVISSFLQRLVDKKTKLKIFTNLKDLCVIKITWNSSYQITDLTNFPLTLNEKTLKTHVNILLVCSKCFFVSIHSSKFLIGVYWNQWSPTRIKNVGVGTLFLFQKRLMREHGYDHGRIDGRKKRKKTWHGADKSDIVWSRSFPLSSRYSERIRLV